MSYSNQSAHIEDHIHRRFAVVKKVGSGAYGHVWKVEEKTTKKIFALKKIFDAFQHSTDAQRTYREIEILRQIEHPNIIKLHETIKAENNRDVYLVFQFVEADLHNVIAENILKDVHIRYIIYQIAKALKYLHSGKVIHRDLKPSNVLVNSNCSIKICDFGLVRSLGNSKNQGVVLTEGVATRWYRAPEVLLGSKSYSTPADIWSFGCIIYQILAQKPLFNGSCTLDQVQKVCAFTGYPSEEDIESLQSEVARSLIKEMKISPNTKPNCILKEFDSSIASLLERMLIFNPHKRITIDEILAHQIVKPFRKIEDEPICKKDICTSIDDNKKVTVDEYRKLVYGIKKVEKIKGLSSSLGAGSVSPKYQNINKSVNFGQNRIADHKPQISKKHSFDQIKSNQMAGYMEETSKKLAEKQNVRYIRSLNNLNKGENGFYQSNYQKKEQEVPNREEVDPHIGQFGKYQQKFGQNTNQFPKYSIANKYNYSELNNKKPINISTPISANTSLNNNSPGSPTSPMSPSSPTWKYKMNTPQGTIISPTEIKEKVLQFRSPKYLNSPKNGGTVTKTTGTLGETGMKKGF